MCVSVATLKKTSRVLADSCPKLEFFYVIDFGISYDAFRHTECVGWRSILCKWRRMADTDTIDILWTCTSMGPVGLMYTSRTV